jgi:endoglucanase
MKRIYDPKNNMLFEVHQYLDADSSGSSGTCVSTTIGRERLAGFVKWLRENGKKGFLGEFAGGNNTTCKAAIADTLKYIHANGDVLRGWLWWAGGPWWGDYKFALDPKSGVDRPQMSWLTPWMR